MLNIMEVMRLPIGTKIKTSINENIVLILIEEKKKKYLTIEGYFGKVFVDSDLTESEFWVVND